MVNIKYTIEEAMNIPSVAKYYNDKPDETTQQKMTYSYLTGLPLGYAETDAHFRDRILKLFPGGDE